MKIVKVAVAALLIAGQQALAADHHPSANGAVGGERNTGGNNPADGFVLQPRRLKGKATKATKASKAGSYDNKKPTKDTPSKDTPFRICVTKGCPSEDVVSEQCAKDTDCVFECDIGNCDVSCDTCKVAGFCSDKACKSDCCDEAPCNEKGAAAFPDCLIPIETKSCVSNCVKNVCELSPFSRDLASACSGRGCCDNARKRFRFLKDLTQFQQHPDPSQLHNILEDIDEADLDASYFHANGVLPSSVLAKAVHHVETAFEDKEFVMDKHKQEFKLPIGAKDLIELLGEDHVLALLDAMSIYEGHVDDEEDVADDEQEEDDDEDDEAPLTVTGAFFQRFDHDNDTVSPYHTDGKTTSLVIMLNDDYRGGEMTFLTREGPVVIKAEAGAVSIHGPGMVHGNAAVDGVKYQLTLLAFDDTDKPCMFDGLLGNASGEEADEIVAKEE